MRYKKTQITLFIIIGIIILIAIAVVFYYTNATKKNNLQTEIISVNNNLDKKVVNTYINKLLESTTYDSIKQVAFQGGEFEPTDYQVYSIDSRSIRVGYALKNNINLLSRKNISNELSKTILFDIKNKIDLSFIEEMGGNYSIDWDNANCKVLLTPTKINVRLKLPIKIETKRNANFDTLSDFQTEVPVDLLSRYNNINLIIDRISAKDGYYNLADDDYSCNLIRICYSGNNILKIRQYKPFHDEPSMLFLVAVDKEPILTSPNTCTRLDNINRVNGGSCP